jgi:hypothetical protein
VRSLAEFDSALVAGGVSRLHEAALKTSNARTTTRAAPRTE